MSQVAPPNIVTLTDGPSTLRFAPSTGGRLLSWEIDGEQIIFWPTEADWSRPAHIRGGNPLLFPFLGRHRVDGTIGRWRDAEGVVRDLPMHGFARDLPFSSQVDADGHGLHMVLTDTDATRTGYPFGFRFEATYRLADPHTLDVTLTTTNTGTERLPYYAGHHFYFALPHAERAQTVFELPPTERRYQQPDGSISSPEPGNSVYRLDDPGIVDRFHCLEAATQPATPIRLVMPGRQRVVTIDLMSGDALTPWYAVTSWTEKPDSDFYCIEPWLGLPDAIHNGLGLRWLAPGATERASLQIGVDSLN